MRASQFLKVGNDVERWATIATKPAVPKRCTSLEPPL